MNLIYHLILQSWWHRVSYSKSSLLTFIDRQSCREFLNCIILRFFRRCGGWGDIVLRTVWGLLFVETSVCQDTSLCGAGIRRDPKKITMARRSSHRELGKTWTLHRSTAVLLSSEHLRCLQARSPKLVSWIELVLSCTSWERTTCRQTERPNSERKERMS